MKNFLLIILGIIIGAAAMYLFCFYDSSITDDDGGVNIPKGLITPEEARTLDQAYDIKHTIINDSLFKNSTDGGDNRSSWWSLEDVEDYLVYAKNQAKSNGYVMDGLRVYLGSYPDTKGSTGLTTMFFIPTGYKNESEGAVFTLRGDGDDLPDSEGLNVGKNGNPPGANYPQ